MTNLLKSYKGEDNTIYPTRNGDDVESIRKWENLIANYEDEGEYAIIYLNCENVWFIIV